MKTENVRNLFSYKDYLNLLKPVLEAIKKNPRASINDLKHILYSKTNLDEMTKQFIYEDGITPGIIIDYGNTTYREAIICGNMQEIPEVKSMKYNTIFDLASTSKLFTLISVLMLVEHKFIDLDAPVNKYVKEFKYLGNVTINDLLKFKVTVETKERIDKAKTLKEAREILYTLHPVERKNMISRYTDMGAIALKYVIENVTTMSFDEFVNDIILTHCNMNDTFTKVPEEKISRVANENYSTIIDEFGESKTTIDNEPGTIYDPKAKKLGHELGFASGHAGYFSTAEDMVKFATAILNNEFIKKESLYSIADSMIDNKTEDGTITKNFGSLVYLKQLNPEFLSVCAPLSGKAFVSPGYCGTSLCIDPLNNLIFFVGSNRLHNRVIKNLSNKKDLDQHSSEKFTLQKEELVKKTVELSIQYQLLEKLFKNEEKTLLVRKI